MLLLAQPVWAEDVYLCIVDQSTGFKHYPQTNEWKSVDFGNGAKYLIKRYELTETDKFNLAQAKSDAFSDGEVEKYILSKKWGIYEFGNDNAIAWCTFEPFPSDCKGNWGMELMLLPSTGRFMMLWPGFFLQSDQQLKDHRMWWGDGSGAPGERNSMAISIGKCSEL